MWMSPLMTPQALFTFIGYMLPDESWLWVYKWLKYLLWHWRNFWNRKWHQDMWVGSRKSAATLVQRNSPQLGNRHRNTFLHSSERVLSCDSLSIRTREREALFVSMCWMTWRLCELLPNAWVSYNMLLQWNLESALKIFARPGFLWVTFETQLCSVKRKHFSCT